jgi:hypothetical protein
VKTVYIHKGVGVVEQPVEGHAGLAFSLAVGRGLRSHQLGVSYRPRVHCSIRVVYAERGCVLGVLMEEGYGLSRGFACQARSMISHVHAL